MGNYFENDVFSMSLSSLRAASSKTFYFRYPYKRFRGPGIPIISTDFRIYYFRDEIISGPVVFYVTQGCETPRGPGLGSESKREKKIQKYKPEKRRNKRSIIKYAHIVGKGVAGEGTTRRRLLGSSSSGERKEKNSRRRRRRRLVRILFNDKSVEIYALRDYPAAAASKNTTCIFFFVQRSTHKSHKRTRERARLYIFLYIIRIHEMNFKNYCIYAAATLFDFVRRRLPFREPNDFFPCDFVAPKI